MKCIEKKVQGGTSSSLEFPQRICLLSRLFIFLRVGVIALTFFSLTACSLKKMAVRQASGFFAESRKVFEEETDLDIAEPAIAANLKLLEAMQVHDPENEDLNLLIAETYSAYTLAFAEDKMEAAEFNGNALEENKQRNRAKALYLRARDYAAKVLLPKLEVIDMAHLTEEGLKAKLNEFDKDALRSLFWYAFAWGSAINVDREDTEGLSNLPKVEIMMEKVKELDEKYYFAGAWLFEGVYFGARSEMLGGNLARSKVAFDKNLTLTQGKLLMTHYFYARTYCIFAQDSACFDKHISAVLDAPLTAQSEQKLANAIAKQKARRLKAHKADFFVE